MVRWLLLLLCFFLADCSSSPEGTPVAAQDNAPNVSSLKVITSLKTVATGEKLQAPLEISAPIEAPAISSIRWIVCLRSGASDESKRRTYSIFFKNDDYVSSRMSAVIEPCAEQVFRPLM
jgi:PBP1b-binding outer membrane lipoprotein LpoB